MTTLPTTTLRNILDDMDAGHVFSFRAYTYDKKRKRCGKRIEYHTAKLLVHNETKLPEHRTLGSLMMKNEKPIIEKVAKKPRHAANATRNIAVGMLLGERFKIIKIVKVHIDLITRYNNVQVLLP